MYAFRVVAHFRLMQFAQLIAHALNASFEDESFHPQVLEVEQR